MSGTLGNPIVRSLNTLWKLVLVLLAVSFISFALIDASPIDPVAAYVGHQGKDNLDLVELQRLQDYFGMNEPFFPRYLNWVGGLLHGDLGVSLIYHQPVEQVIGAKIASSLMLMLTAWALSGVLGFFLGVLAGVFRDRVLDKLIKGYSLLLASAPTFWLAMLMLIIFSVWLKIFPIGLSVPIGVLAENVTFADSIRHLILPAVTLSVIGIANITLHTREKMIEIMGQDYILYARSRGENLPAIVKNHGLRNVLLPAITLQFASFSEIIGGSVLVEQVFSYPGLGQSAVSAGLRGDAPLLLGIVMVTAIMVFAGNMTANVLYGIVDPRIRRGVHG
ncbi:ABC transporter permease [Desulfosporosinus meridiei]|uniref:ABC-type dipeptide/oligopeptide/nickel transport system, permease component n=1 Tax=Desulfosporosinus meridiei (strain ATCC BAA-275 / DSM 13257 / KCTC 12902 / NCIMB 13706 / S10) TaxID=768704 RepID=J7ILV5_DESMD|nr:ABC transporter permease [Desulfosporosinus meridiei]AFQ42560.1 ABC-type dipeptide/oligopeptide/nickel transport system, permease component [Desulfosporosinus meridiei DSM 13257]